MMSFKKYFLVVLYFCISGCATGPSISEVKSSLAVMDQTKGRIYFYRDGFFGAAYQPDVKLNDLPVGRAVPKGVYFKDVTPGRYKVTTSMTDKKVDFTIEAGQIKYIKISYGFGFSVYPELVDPLTAENEIQKLSFIPIN